LNGRVTQPPLDAEVDATRDVPGRWGWFGLAQVLLPFATLLVIFLVVVAADLPKGDTAAAVWTLVAELSAGAVVWRVGRGFAARYGGWRAAFGFDLPRRTDIGTVVGWTLLQLGARIALIVALPDSWSGHGGNTEGVSDLSPVGLLAIGAASVLVAPPLEELGFRGVVLRGLMRRTTFWPAAAGSAVLFGVLHSLGASSLAAVPLLVLATALFGLLQCVLVRRTGRLGPAIGVHAATNLLVLVLATSSGT
jgi:membrane protease YdiL (CAAX protease family)